MSDHDKKFNAVKPLTRYTTTTATTAAPGSALGSAVISLGKLSAMRNVSYFFLNEKPYADFTNRPRYAVLRLTLVGADGVYKENSNFLQ